MSHGRIGRARRRHPDAKRRLERYGNTRFGERSNNLPPHLMPSAKDKRNGKSGGLITPMRLLLLAGGLAVTALTAFLVITVISGAMGIVGTIRAYEEVNADLPDAAGVTVDTFQTTRIYDRNGTLLQEVDNPDYGWRSFVDYDDISPHLIDATVAAEDSTFWNHQGVEPFAIARGAFINLSGSGSSGGSTVTQQLVRAVYPDQISAMDISYTRKFREALAAVALDREYSKQDIMTMYLNQIYYGSRSYGIEAASQTFFDKNASDLTLAEASLLAGLPQAPSSYNPADPDSFPVAKQRQQYVLNQMVRYGYISHDEANEAYNEPLQIAEGRSGTIHAAPHFTGYVREYIIDTYGIEALYSGLEVTTSIDLDLQASAEEVLASGVADMEQFNRNNGAMVVMVPWSGEVLAMVGSADFNDSLIGGQVNYATSLIQPGSSIKPLIFAAAFDQGMHPASVMMDVPTEWETPGQEPYAPQNYTRQFYGAVTARSALANSLNLPAVKATEYVGVQEALDVSRDMGLTTSLQEDAGFYGISFGLGAGEVQLLEHTNAFSTLANNGTHVPPSPILEIKDGQGNVLYENDQETIEEKSSQAVSAGSAYQVTSILTDTEAREMIFTEDNLFATTESELDRPVAAKSGTTENWRDTWTMGYTTDVSIGVWVGRSGDTGATNMPELDGIQAAGPIWQEMMYEVHDNSEFAELLVGPDGETLDEEFPQPDEVFRGEVCSATGHQPERGSSTTRDYLVRGAEPELACGELSDYEQDELDNALAQLRDGNVRWAGDAIGSINDYARASGANTVPVRGPSSSSTDDEGSSDGFEDEERIEPLRPDEEDDEGDDDQPLIEPAN